MCVCPCGYPLGACPLHLAADQGNVSVRVRVSGSGLNTVVCVCVLVAIPLHLAADQGNVPVHVFACMHVCVCVCIACEWVCVHTFQCIELIAS